jgi:hypothetical protein
MEGCREGVEGRGGCCYHSPLFPCACCRSEHGALPSARGGAGRQGMAVCAKLRPFPCMHAPLHRSSLLRPTFVACPDGSCPLPVLSAVPRH